MLQTAELLCFYFWIKYPEEMHESALRWSACSCSSSKALLGVLELWDFWSSGSSGSDQAHVLEQLQLQRHVANASQPQSRDQMAASNLQHPAALSASFTWGSLSPVTMATGEAPSQQ